jgi:translocator protein
MKNLPKLFVSVIDCELVGIISTPFTIAAIPSWYATLVKPPFSPPNWLFGPVWTLLYFLMGISFYLIWKQGWQKKKIKTAGLFFLAQLGLNFLWSLLFFGLRSPALGLIDIGIMLILIVMTMRKFYALSKQAFYLLLPYLFWVSFATLLNLAILVLN